MHIPLLLFNGFFKQRVLISKWQNNRVIDSNKNGFNLVSILQLNLQCGYFASCLNNVPVC